MEIPHALESLEVYEANKRKNAQIQEDFKASLTEDNLWKGMKTPKHSIYIPSKMVLRNGRVRNTPYGDSTLGEDGCAIFCIHNVLTAKYGIDIPIGELAEMCADQGYHVSGKGTRHNLFDHMGCKRATHVQEIFDCLSKESKAFVTLLVRNDAYHDDSERTGRHFVNLVSYSYMRGIRMYIRINDDSIGNNISKPMKTLLATDIAWIWPRELPI